MAAATAAMAATATRAMQRATSASAAPSIIAARSPGFASAPTPAIAAIAASAAEGTGHGQGTETLQQRNKEAEADEAQGRRRAFDEGPRPEDVAVPRRTQGPRVLSCRAGLLPPQEHNSRTARRSAALQPRHQQVEHRRMKRFLKPRAGGAALDPADLGVHHFEPVEANQHMLADPRR